ncbi:hypothetical protein [Onishia niordana]|uniref:hypothetical protein n=1 Tax=Onishia niordana TaxID=2508711 RepID=UPI00109FD0B0|nr:hypothetical protein [Halomonas niordiana]
MDDVIRDSESTASSPGGPKPGDWVAEEASTPPSAPTPTVHQLSSCEVIPGGGEVGQQASHPCEDDTWADILYLSGTGTFWLLTQPVSDALHEAADQLAQIVAESDPQARMTKLSEEAGLAGCIMPATLDNFLNSDKRKDYQEKQRELDRVEELEASRNGAAGRRERRIALGLKHDIEILRREGQREAERQGFETDGDRFYGAWEQEIETALTNYRECRQDYVERFVEGEAPVGDAIRYAFRYTALCGGVSPYVARRSCPVEDYADYLDEQNDSAEASYIQSILQLAAMGIATPELALADPSRQTPGLQPGVSDFDGYNHLLKELPDIASSMDAKLEDWRDSTAGQAALPIFLLEEERSRYEDYCRRLDAFYETARQTTEAMEPRRVLYWNADVTDPRHALGYRKRSVDVLVRNDFPLREFSSPLGPQSLSHLSLHQLAALAMTAEEHESLKRGLPGDGALPAQLWEAPESALSQWLTGRGCQSIEWDPAWHDETLGLFEPERFFAHLDEQEIQVASLEGQREAWGETLQHMLFTGPSLEVLRLFDASAQAQYLRMVGMSYGDLKEQVAPDRPQEIQATGPSLSLEVMDGSVSADAGSNLEAEAKDVGQRVDERQLTTAPAADSSAAGGLQNRPDRGASAKASYSAKAEAKFNLVAGELSFGTFSLPEEANAEPIEVTLHNKGDERRSLGCYALRLEPVAKGFAGASAALAAETGLSVGQNGVSIVGLDRATQAGTAASFKAFAGVGITVQCSVALRWKPPTDILQRLPKYAALDELGMLSEPLDDWGELSKATLAAEALAGIGAEADFQIGLIDGKFVLTLKARLVLKGGVGGKFSVELDPDRLDPWMGMLHQALVDNDYEVVDWITPAAFEGFSKLFFMQTMLLVDVGMLALRGVDYVDSLYDDFTRSDRAGPIAYAIVDAENNPEKESQLKAWIQQLPPEALGPLLHVLRAEPGFFDYDIEGQSYGRGQAIDLQQVAIFRCLKWIEEGYMHGLYPRSSTQTRFEKSVARMSIDGKYPGSDTDESEEEKDRYFGRSYCTNRYKLDEFMGIDTGSDDANARIARSGYESLADRLGSGFDSQCEIVMTPAGRNVSYRRN